MKTKLAISALLVIALLATSAFAGVTITDTSTGRAVWASSIWDALKAWFAGGITGAQVAPPPLLGLLETDPAYACGTPQQCCSDNIDNDGNTLTDAADGACARFALIGIVYIPVNNYQGRAKSGSGGTPSSPPPAPGPGPNGGNGGNGGGGGGGAPNGPAPGGGPGGPPAGPIPPAPGNGGGVRAKPAGAPGGGCTPLGPFQPGGFGGGGGFGSGGGLGGDAIGVPEGTQWTCFYDNGQQFFGVEGGISFEQIILPNGKVIAQIEFIVNEAGAQFFHSLGPNVEYTFTIPGDGATIAWIIPTRDVLTLEDPVNFETDFTTVSVLDEEI